MNSDTPQPGQPPASPTPTPPRSSNLKGRWKRGPNPVTGATVAPRPATPANFGEVKDITSVKESLSGQHIRGYEQDSVPAASTAQMTAPAPVPAAPPPAPVAPAPRTESFTPRPQPVAAPAPRPAAVNPTPSRPAPPPPSAEYLALREAQRAEAKQNPRPSQPARSTPQPRPMESTRPPQENRGRGQDGRGGERENFVALKPDPADPAPRRLRTEAARPVPVEEYSPSNFGRVPDKSIPSKQEHRSERDHRSPKDRSSDRDRHADRDRTSDRRESAPSSSGERPRPNATIPARITPSKTAKAKSGGIFGFIKKIFGDSSKERKMEKSPSALREDEAEHKPEEGDDGQDHRSHNRSSQGHHGDNRRGGQRRSGRR